MKGPRLANFSMSFDPETGATYIYNRGQKSKKGVVSKTVEARGLSNVYVDYEKDGKIFGIEILNVDRVKLGTIMKLFGELKGS